MLTKVSGGQKSGGHTFSASVQRHCTRLNQPARPPRPSPEPGRWGLGRLRRRPKPTAGAAGPLSGRRARPLSGRRAAERRRSRATLASRRTWTLEEPARPPQPSPEAGWRGPARLSRHLKAGRWRGGPLSGQEARLRAVRAEPTLELAGARPHGQVACYAARLGRAGSGDACRARRSDVAAHRSKAVARSGAEAVRRVPWWPPMWSMRANGAAARRAAPHVLEAWYDAAPHTLARRHNSDPNP